MIRFEHVNLVVSDVEASVRFYQTAIPHWRVRTSGEDQWNGKPRRWLHLGDDYQYITLNDNGEGDNRSLQGHQVGLAHFGIETDAIDALIERMKAAGYEPHQVGEMGWRKNAYFLDPAGFEVEFVQYSADEPEKRNQ